MGEPEVVLLALDESPYSEAAFQSITMSDEHIINDILHEEKQRIKAFLGQLQVKLQKAGIGGKVKSVGGTPGEVICKVAYDEKVHFIVIGSRGTSTVRNTILGSVSDYVMHHSHVPVLICKQQQ